MEVSPAESGFTEISNTEIAPGKRCLAEVSLSNVGPAEVWFTEECKMEVSITEIRIVQIGIVKVELTEVYPVGINPSKIGLYIWMLQSLWIPRGTPLNKKFTEASLFRSIVLDKRSSDAFSMRMSMDNVVLGSESA